MVFAPIGHWFYDFKNHENLTRWRSVGGSNCKGEGTKFCLAVNGCVFLQTEEKFLSTGEAFTLVGAWGQSPLAL